MNNKTRLLRLRKLREVLVIQRDSDALAIPARLNGKFAWFNMYSWFEQGSHIHAGHGCNTSACALGSCALHPWFAERGLRISRGAECPVYENRGRRYRNFTAGAEFFGIKMNESFQLFDPDQYRGIFARGEPIKPQEVISRVDKLIRKYQRTPQRKPTRH